MTIGSAPQPAPGTARVEALDSGCRESCARSRIDPLEASNLPLERSQEALRDASRVRSRRRRAIRACTCDTDRCH